MNIRNNKKRALEYVDIVYEINNAEKERRPVDLSNAVIADLSMIMDRVKEGLNLENSEVKDSVFLGEIFISGELNMKNAIINGSLYLGNAAIEDDLILENANIKGAINLVGANIRGNINAKNLTIAGFLSLDKADIGEDVILENANIKSVNYEDLIIRGDLFFGKASIGGSLNMVNLANEGIIDMENLDIGGNLVLTGIRSEKEKIDTTTISLGGKKIV